MEIISSLQNPLIKEARKLRQKKYREQTKKFLVEGIRLVEEGLSAQAVEWIFHDETLEKTERGYELLKRSRKYVQQHQGRSCFKVKTSVLQALSETQTSQGIVAVAVQGNVFRLHELAVNEGPGLLLILDGLQDPGNMGTLLRTAWACGAGAAICLPGTVEPFNSKVVRSTMGSIFRLPLITDEDWPTVAGWCREKGYTLVAGDLQAGDVYYDLAYPKRVALVIGNEGKGFVNASPDEIDLRAKIPLFNGVESLNAAVAGGILLYEIIRQQS